MAIKGKRKSQKSRPKAAPPRPVVVTHKPPFFARRWVQITIVGVVAVAAGLGFGYGFARQANESDARTEKASAMSVVSTYQKKVDSALALIGSPRPPSNFDVLPDLSPALSGLKDGSKSASEAKKVADESAKLARDAWKAIDGVNLSNLIIGKGLSGELGGELFGSQKRMTQGLRLIEQVAHELRRAAESDRPEQAFLIAQAQQELEVALQLFGDGYTDYVSAQTAAGTFVPIQQQQQPLLPPELSLPPPSPGA